MASLDQIVAFLDSELRTAEIPDYPGAMNGLQLANDGHVGRIVAAVDASLPVIEAVAEGGPGLLIVHHGMFWQGVRPVTGPFYRKLKIAMEAGLAIYSSHLPLDLHPKYGNNILLAKGIGLQNPEPFLDQKGLLIGLKGDWCGNRSEMAAKIEGLLGGQVTVCPGGPEVLSKVGIVTGGAGSEVARVIAEGVDSFVTGEGPHWSYSLAEELGLNVFYGGHYATETSGVQAICGIVAKKFQLEWSFFDHPSGL